MRSASRPTRTVASSSAVASRMVAKRQCSTSSSPRNMPRWVWVLPTSIASSMRARSKHADPLDALTLQAASASRPSGRIRVELEQRHQHEAPRRDLRVRQREALGLELDVPQQQQVDVDHSWPVADLRSPSESSHMPCKPSGAPRGPARSRRYSSIEEVGLVEDLALWLCLVDRRFADDVDVAGQRINSRPQVRQPVAHVRAEPEVAPQSWPRSFHTSTETSSTGSAIGGSGLAARTDTASAP